MAADRPLPRVLSYDVVDVFTDEAFAGNPLAVVHGAEHLDDGQLLAIAKEFNLSETTFPMPLTAADAEAGADYRVRIFTPGTEIPFAGHPTLGTAWVLRRRGDLAPGQRLQSCGAGLVGVAVPDDPAGPVELSAIARDHARELGADDTATVAGLVGLAPADAVGRALVAGCGLTWVFLQVTPETVGRARAASTALTETDVDLSGLRDPVDGVSVFALTDGSDGVLQVSARVFVPGFGIPEDPATGSAAAGLGLVLVRLGRAAPVGSSRYRIEQGVALGRPSVLAGRVEAADGVATTAHVAGQVVAVARGEIAVPRSL